MVRVPRNPPLRRSRAGRGARRTAVCRFPGNELLNFVVPSPLQLFSPAAIYWLSAHFTGDASSRDAYLGLPLLAWFAIQVRHRWGDRVIRWAALVALILAVLSLGPALHVAG